ncbi:rod shape-determining protein MreC [Selenomonadales bacterium OttesenSCG-928-I06]|nr:rod shape-determining protein MreC [Selenomonadales bacterium OttesenSCG-928-I06]
MGFFRKKSVILIIVFLVVLTLSGLVATKKYKVAFLETTFNTVLAPFEQATSFVSFKINNVVYSFSDFISVYRKNQLLREENNELRKQLLNSNEIAAENNRLNKMLDYQNQNQQHELVISRIIGRDPGSWTNIIIINRGTKDGITKNMAVINQSGLIGNVINAYPNCSKVQLITDPRSAVGALVQREESRVAGILEGNSSTPSNPHMVNLANDADIIVGDKIITSGFGGIYPKGLLIGEVTEIINDEIGFLKNAKIAPAVNLNKLEEVFVIKKTREQLPFTDSAESASSLNSRGGNLL